MLDNFVAELTSAAYFVAIRHGTADTWLDLELDLWRALADTVKQWAGIAGTQIDATVPFVPSSWRADPDSVSHVDRTTGTSTPSP
jgi:hypothetical protein